MTETNLLVTRLPGAAEASGNVPAGPELRQAFEQQGIVATPCMYTRDAIGAGYTYLGEVIELTKAIAPAVSVVICVWLKARHGRKVRLKFDGIEAEAQTPEDVSRLIQRAQEYQQQKREGRHLDDQ